MATAMVSISSQAFQLQKWYLRFPVICKRPRAIRPAVMDRFVAQLKHENNFHVVKYATHDFSIYVLVDKKERILDEFGIKLYKVSKNI
jgi:hypothetical protein